MKMAHYYNHSIMMKTISAKVNKIQTEYDLVKNIDS